MKKIMFCLALLLTITFCTPPLISVYASTSTSTTENEETEEKEDIGGFFDNFFESIKTFFQSLFPPTKLPPPKEENGVAKASTFSFQAINNILLNNDYSYYFINPARISDVLLKACGSFGIIIFFCLFLVECGKSNLDFDLLDGKGLVKIGTQLLTGIVILSICSPILQLISTVTYEITSNVLQVSNIDIVSLTGNGISSWDFYANDIPVIGWLYQLVNWILGNITLLIYNIFILVFAMIISISLVLRTIKLAIYQGVSPLFFACIGSKPTQRYFQNFLVQYIALSLQLVFIAAIYSAFQIAFVSYMKSMVWGAGFSWTAFGSGFIIMFSFTFMIVKSGKLFDKVLT